MAPSQMIQAAFEQGRGILRLALAWVPRVFCVPSRRIKLHPDDYLVLGGRRGGIDERWLASTIPAWNGPFTGEHEGLSQVVSRMVDRRDGCWCANRETLSTQR